MQFRDDAHPGMHDIDFTLAAARQTPQQATKAM
jgi:hypothetical protein